MRWTDGVFRPGIADAFEFGTLFDLGAADFIDGLTQELHDVEAVEGDLGLGQVLGDAPLVKMAMKAALMSMHTCLIREASPRWASR